MTLVELFVLALAGLAIYFALSPLRRKLESILYLIFRPKTRRNKTVVDITDYSKKKDN
jgi:hypothetical protein